MPIYIVKCKKCERVEEVLCPMSEREKQVCPDCNEIMELTIQPVSAVWGCECPTASGGRPCS